MGLTEGTILLYAQRPTNEVGLSFCINLLDLDGSSAANMNVEYTDD